MTAAPLPVPKARFFDNAGAPLVGGKVYTYSAGTTTPKTSYTDYTAGTPNANPVILNSNGEADIWLDGNYKIVLKDSADVQQWSVDNISTLTSQVTFAGGTVTGTANALIVSSVTPTNFTLATGISVTIIPVADNTIAATINVASSGVKSIKLYVNGAVVDPAAGQLKTGVPVTITYNGTYWILGAYLSLGGGALTGALTSNSTIGTTSNLGAGIATPTQAVHVFGNNQKVYFDGTTNDYSISNTGTDLKIRHETIGGNVATISGNGSVVSFAVGNIAAPANIVFDVANASTTAASRPEVSLTTTQRDALTPVLGGSWYNTTTNLKGFYNGTKNVEPPITQRFTSSDQTVTSAALLTLAHGLGVRPFNIQTFLVCQTSENGYTAGDIIQYPGGISSSGTDGQGFTIRADVTNVYVRYGNAATPLYVNNGTTGAGTTLTNANWKLRVEAFA